MSICNELVYSKRENRLSTTLISKYEELKDKYEGRWFALTRDAKLVAIARDSDRLWKKIRKKLEKEEIDKIDLFVGYAQTRKERESSCLLPFISMNMS